MLINKPAEQVEVCDFCGRDGYLQTCDVCGKRYCLSDDGRVAQSWGFLEICRLCQDRADVQAVCERYAKQLTPIFRKRREALKRLPKEEKKRTLKIERNHG